MENPSLQAVTAVAVAASNSQQALPSQSPANSQPVQNKNVVIMDPNSQLSEQDAELLKFIEESKPKIIVIGAGGSGSNTVNRLAELGVVGASLCAMNTDAQHLFKIKAERKLLIGKRKTRGHGAGSNPEVGEAAALESYEEIKSFVKGASLVFVTCGMGGGTGTGASHVIAKAAKEEGAIVVGVVTVPFSSEGPKRMENAIIGFNKLKRQADTTITIQNDKLLSIVANQPLNSAFKVCDSVLGNAVKGITEVITKPGLVNLDFADVRTILEKSGIAVITIGEESKGDANRGRAYMAAEKALSSPLLDVDISQANKALINVIGGEGMTLGEAESAVNLISSKIGSDAHIIWGAAVDNTLQNDAVRVILIISGLGEATAEERREATEELIESIS